MAKTQWMIRHFKPHLSPRFHLAMWREKIRIWKKFWQSYQQYQELALPHQKLNIEDCYPCFGDDTPETQIDPTYFYQDAWAFEKIVRQQPKFHVDVGSHHKFVALLSKVVPVTMVDLRPLSLPLNTLKFQQGSLLNLPFEDNSIFSLSSLCVVEHIGLGRYGDPLDPWGTEKSIAELHRVLAPGGRLYLSIPLGNRTIVAFNAGRILSLDDFLQLIAPLIVVDRSFIVGSALQEHYEPSPSFGTTGLFELIKPVI